jgi:type IV pilus assembly protein PilN
MATRINLLPWREELRKQRERNFYTGLGFAVALGAAIGLAGHWYFDGRIDYQQRRNALLQDEIAQLDRRIVRIRELEETRARLEARMRVIETLQQGRPQVVHLMHQFVATLPDGLYLTSLRDQGERITLTGVAESNARVSNFMENLERSDWLVDPNLAVIEVRERNGIRISDFTLSVAKEAVATEPPAQDGGSR